MAGRWSMQRRSCEQIGRWCWRWCRRDGWGLGCAAEELRADREVVLAAVRQHGRGLEYAAEELRADREVVLAVVRRDGWALGCAAEELRADREVVLAAVRQHGRGLGYAAEELRADRHFILDAIQWNPSCFSFSLVQSDPYLKQALDHAEQVEAARQKQRMHAKTPPDSVQQVPADELIVLSTYNLHCIQRAEAGTRLSAAVEDGINAFARLSWPDFELAIDLGVDDGTQHLYDFIFCLRDETGDIVAFRSAVWEESGSAWVFQNGVVRDQGNGLGSIMLQQVVRFFLLSALVPGDRRRGEGQRRQLSSLHQLCVQGCK